jgi:hypothetical protein
MILVLTFALIGLLAIGVSAALSHPKPQRERTT